MTAAPPPLSQLVADGRQALLGWAELADPMIAGMMARAGFDAILLDAQHGFHNEATVVAGITEAALCGKPALVRVAVGAYPLAARMLDYGAAGVVAPMINTAEDASRFVTEVKYPPLGGRSWGPTRAMQIQRQTDPQAFLAEQNARCAAIAMIETRSAMDNLDAILAVEGLDGVLIGPGDLSIGLSGGRLDPVGTQVSQAIATILQAARRNGKLACAFAGTQERAADMVALGFDFTTVGYDAKLIGDAFGSAVASVRGRVDRPG